MSFGLDLLAGLRGVRDQLKDKGGEALAAAEGLVARLEPLAGGDTPTLEREAVSVVADLAGSPAAAVHAEVPEAGTSARLDALEARTERLEHLQVPAARSVLPPAGQAVVPVADQRAAGVPATDTVTVADQRAGVPVPEPADVPAPEPVPVTPA
jgi:hypothetical protein